MKIIADLHIHSPYSRAVSRDMTLENLDEWARLKGITVMGTGDFTHPAWIKEIKNKLEPAEPGLYKLSAKGGSASGEKNKNSETRFLLTVEISSIYSQGGRVRRVHSLIFAPSVETAEKINIQLDLCGNIKSDGRPILGLSAKDLAKLVWDIDDRVEVVPAHAWTPWFSVFGSMSGFDSLEECYDELAPRIRMIETGLSSDPAMNWRLSRLDRVSLISNSDAHSLPKIGREANVVEAGLGYEQIMNALASRDPKRFLYTIEFFPEEGKYHYDGHRVCRVRLKPEETKKMQNQCPVCGKPVTVGVLNRVEKLADRPEEFRPDGAVPYKSMVPLDEIIAEALGVSSPAGKNVRREYRDAVERYGNEFAILHDCTRAELELGLRAEIAEGIMRAREGRLHIDPGYDGEYGKVKIFSEGEISKISRQNSFF